MISSRLAPRPKPSRGRRPPTRAIRVTIETPDLSASGVARLEAEWRELEERSACSFFQSWTWIGCLVAERFGAPLLARARNETGELVGLALFNRRGLPLAPRALWLHQTGHAPEDSVFIEHNGPLIARGHEDAAASAIVSAALAHAGTVVLSGIDGALHRAVSALGVRHVRALRPAPFASLGAAGASGWRAGLGASTRAQLGRSHRRLETLGPVSWRWADGIEAAQAELARLAALHGARWRREGQGGAFAEPAFVRFHAELLRRALPRGEAAIGRLSAGEHVVCILYEFRWRGTVLAYQSGVDMEAAPNASPGLVAHAYSIEEAERARRQRYDFLAGEARYKRNLGQDSVDLVWLELSRATSPRGLPMQGMRQLRSGAQHLIVAARRII